MRGSPGAASPVAKCGGLVLRFPRKKKGRGEKTEHLHLNAEKSGEGSEPQPGPEVPRPCPRRKPCVARAGLNGANVPRGDRASPRTGIPQPGPPTTNTDWTGSPQLTGRWGITTSEILAPVPMAGVTALSSGGDRHPYL